MDDKWYKLELEMVNAKNDCHSHILNHWFQPFQNNDIENEKKKNIHVFSAIEKILFDMLSLENIISDIEPNVSNKQETIWCKSLHDSVWNYM